MFVKPFRTKSAVTVRNSDRRKLKSRLATFFPGTPEESLAHMVPAKGDFKETKVITHKGEPVSVFTADGEPTVIEMKNGTLIPYLYSLWSVEVNAPALHTTSNVLERFANGADLMAPGIIPTPDGLCDRIERNKGVCVRIAGQRHSVAIGVAEQSSEQLMKGLSGKAVRIVSCVGDQLWASGSKKIPPTESDPQFRTLTPEEIENLEINDDNEEKVETSPEENNEDIEVLETEQTEEDKEKEETDGQETEKTVEEVRNEQDSLLEACFKLAIKSKLQEKKEALPLLCSTFFSQYLLPSVPSGKELKIKKTSFKKLSSFFAEMEKEQILRTEQVSSGVDQIVSVDFKHSYFRGWQSSVESSTSEDTAKPMVQILGSSSTKEDYSAPAVTQLYVVSGQVENLFTSVGCRRGAILTVQDIRKFVTMYIEANDLRGKKDVKMDPVLHQAVFGKGGADKDIASWDKVFGGVQAKMGSAYSVKFPGQSTAAVKKGKMPRIDLNTKKVSGNKMVSLITGFESFFLDPQLFADKMKKLAQASASIGPDVSGKFIQVQIQGNQAKHVEKVLTKDFNIEKRFIYGLEAAAKGQKKGKK